MGLIRSIIILSALVAIVYVGATVNLGKRTFFGHVQNIWASDATQELVDDVQESGEPLVDRIVRGTKKGVEEAKKDPPAPAPQPQPH